MCDEGQSGSFNVERRPLCAGGSENTTLMINWGRGSKECNDRIYATSRHTQTVNAIAQPQKLHIQIENYPICAGTHHHHHHHIYLSTFINLICVCVFARFRRLANKKSINRVEHRRSTFYYKIMNTRVRVCTYVCQSVRVIFFRYQFFCCVCVCVGSTDTTFACAHGGSAHGVHGAQCSAVSTPWRACALARETHNRQSYMCVCARARIDYKRDAHTGLVLPVRRVDRPTETCISNLSMHTRGGCLATWYRVLSVWNIYNIQCTR